jgi:hypothetical protein
MRTSVEEPKGHNENLTVTFVDESIEDAIERAKEAAGERIELERIRVTETAADTHIRFRVKK